MTTAQISDATAFGRSLMTTASATTARALLGVSDIGDQRNAAIARAMALCGFTSPPRVWHASMDPAPTTLASAWGTKTGAGTITRILTGADIGSREVAATSGGGYALVGRSEAPSFVDPITANAIGTRWYTRYWMKITSTVPVDGTSDLGFGLQGLDSTYTDFIVLGANGGVSGTKFALQKFAGSSVLSSVSIDGNWHLFETWSNPDTDATGVYGSVDSESAIHLAGLASFTQGLGPWLHVYAGGANQSARFTEQFVITAQP
jgi:hypothetical protein